MHGPVALSCTTRLPLRGTPTCSPCKVVGRRVACWCRAFVLFFRRCWSVYGAALQLAQPCRKVDYVVTRLLSNSEIAQFLPWMQLPTSFCRATSSTAKTGSIRSGKHRNVHCTSPANETYYSLSVLTHFATRLTPIGFEHRICRSPVLCITSTAMALARGSFNLIARGLAARLNPAGACSLACRPHATCHAPSNHAPAPVWML